MKKPASPPPNFGLLYPRLIRPNPEDSAWGVNWEELEKFQEAIGGSPVNAKVKPRAYPKLPREVHWRSSNGRWVVVAGPFPNLMPRTETRDDPKKAQKCAVDGVVARQATTRDDQYAKVAADDIIEIKKGHNEFGPVTP